MHAFHLKSGHFDNLWQLAAAGKILLRDESDSRAPACAQPPHRCSIIPGLCLRWLVAPPHRTDPTGIQIYRAETRDETHFGLGLVRAMLSPFCVCVLCASCRAVRLLSAWTGYVGGFAVGSQPWPAGLSLPTRSSGAGRVQPVCICRLLTSYLIALTHQLLLLRGLSNLFIYWFPTRLRQD